MFDVDSVGGRMHNCEPGLGGGFGIEPAAERVAELEVAVGVTCFEHCAPFCPCSPYLYAKNPEYVPKTHRTLTQQQ